MARANVIIVGGGLTGAATAFYLASAGLSVRVLEREQLNAGASGQNAGSLHFQLEHRFVEHGVDGRELAELFPLTLQAIEDWRRLPEELGSPLGLAMHGGLMVAETPDEVDKLRVKCALESRCGLNTRLITGDEARALAPYLASGILAASYCDVEGHANPRLVTGAFARAARKAGAAIDCDRSVVSIVKRNRCFEIETIATTSGARAETFTAERLVLAAGAWSAQIAVLLNLHMPVIPLALTMSVTEPVPPMIGHLIQHVGRRLSLKQVADGNLLIGGGWPARLAGSQRPKGQFDLGIRPQLLESSVRGNLATAMQVIPSIRDLLLLRSWTGTVAVTADQQPLLGSVDACPGLYIAAGGTGFTLGPTMSRLLAELIVTGDTSLPISQFSPQRYAHLNAFMGEAR